MQTVHAWLGELDFSLPTVMIIGAVVMAGIAAFMLARIFFPEALIADLHQRFDAARGQAPPLGGRPGDLLPNEAKQRARALGQAFVGRMGDANVCFVSDKLRQRLGRRFLALGRPEFRPGDFIAYQQLCAILFAALGLMLMNLLDYALWYAIPFAVFGFFFPYLWLADQIRKRQLAIARALPYNIDILTLSVEAGLDFQAALHTVVEKGKPGPLLEEFALTLNEIRLGKTRAEALRNMADRIQVIEISAFVSNIIQAERMGTSLGKVLRIQSNQMRIARTHRAEKLANEAPVKMLLPLIGCIFPLVFLILFGPIVYRLMYGGG